MQSRPGVSTYLSATNPVMTCMWWNQSTLRLTHCPLPQHVRSAPQSSQHPDACSGACTKARRRWSNLRQFDHQQVTNSSCFWHLFCHIILTVYQCCFAVFSGILSGKYLYTFVLSLALCLPYILPCARTTRKDSEPHTHTLSLWPIKLALGWVSVVSLLHPLLLALLTWITFFLKQTLRFP